MSFCFFVMQVQFRWSCVLVCVSFKKLRYFRFINLTSNRTAIFFVGKPQL